MALFTKEQEAQLLRNGSDENTGSDHYPVVKLFFPDTKIAFLFTELDNEVADLVYGLCIWEYDHCEMKDFSFSALTEMSQRMGIPLVRDRAFVARHPISIYAQAASIAQRLKRLNAIASESPATPTNLKRPQPQ